VIFAIFCSNFSWCFPVLEASWALRPLGQTRRSEEALKDLPDLGILCVSLFASTQQPGPLNWPDPSLRLSKYSGYNSACL
jgi:hypothetical protein